MATNMMQASFTAGELAPVLQGRVDLQKYQSGAALLENWIPMQYGGVTNRPGLEYVIYAKSRASRSRLIPFQAENGDAFVIELADEKIRFIRNGGVIVDAIASVDDITNGSPLVVTTVAVHGLTTGDLVAISGVSGMTELNGHVFKVYVDSVWQFRLAHPVTLQTIDGSDYGVWTSGGVISRVYEITSPWASADLPEIDYAQSVDLVVLVHPDYPPQELRRVADDNWTLTEFSMSKGPFQEIGTNQAATLSCLGLAAGGSGTITCSSLSASDVGKYIYISAVDRKGSWESGKNLATGYFYISNGYHYYINSNNATTGTKAPTHDSGEQWDGIDDGTGTSSVQWEYLHSGWGVAHIDDENVTPNVYDVTASTRIPNDAATWRWALQEFDDTRGYPRAVCFYQQRLFFGGNKASPESVWASRIGDYSDFIRTLNVNADDPLKFSSASRKLNKVRFLDGINSLICLTSSGESVVSGADGIISPASISIRPQSYLGCADVKPLLIGNRMLFVQSKGRVLRDMAFSLEADSFIGDDLTLMAPHLFAGKTIVATAYAQHPYSVVWVVLDDGSLLSLTYYREQEVLAWARHTTDGLVEDAVVVSEGGEDALYLLVNRDGFDNINAELFGTNRRFIERMRNREMLGIEDAFFVDGGLSYDGNNASAVVVFLSTSGGWTQDDTIRITASDNVFDSSMAGQSFVFRIGDESIEIVITAVIDADEIDGIPAADIPASLRLVNSTDWAIAIKTIRNLYHLSSREVTVLSDGNVLGPYTVTDAGVLEMEQAGSRIVVGLPYESTLQTLPINVLGGETTQPRQKSVHRLTVVCEDTRGLEAGPDTDHLTEFRAPLRDRYAGPVALKTGLWDTAIRADWKQQAQVVIRQSHPLPATILSIIPEVTLGG